MSKKDVRSFVGVAVGFCLAFFIINVFLLDNDWSMAETLYRTAIVSVLFAVVYGVIAYILAKMNKKEEKQQNQK